MPVVFVVVLPVFDVGLTSDWAAACEWSGTFSGIDEGAISVYRLYTNAIVAHLSIGADTKFCCCLFIANQLLLAAGRDGKVNPTSSYGFS
jgi:hypothetical protein